MLFQAFIINMLDTCSGGRGNGKNGSSVCRDFSGNEAAFTDIFFQFFVIYQSFDLASTIK